MSKIEVSYVNKDIEDYERANNEEIIHKDDDEWRIMCF